MPKELWFKNKTYGWGWTPANWKGWAVTIIYILALLSYPFLRETGQEPFSEDTYLIIGLALTAALISICYLKGEKPEWRWGKKNRE